MPVTLTSFDVSKPEKPTILRDSDAMLDYTFDWAQWLTDAGGDSIASVEFITDPLSTIDIELDSGFLGTKTTAWVSGGTLGQTEFVTHRITTAAGRVEDRTMYFKMKAR